MTRRASEYKNQDLTGPFQHLQHRHVHTSFGKTRAAPSKRKPEDNRCQVHDDPVALAVSYCTCSKRHIHRDDRARSPAELGQVQSTSVMARSL